MLHQLNFDVTFASTGRNLKGDHAFNKGLSAITGPNESGKSMRLEMIRFCLFGTKALRSKAASYTKLVASLTFQIGETVYAVDRTKSNASLTREGVQIAIGTSPVNAEIERIFGYNMEVFDTANACLQGEVEALSKMGATDRKKMVDKIIGLDTIDDLIKEVTAEMSGQRMVVEGLEKQYQTELPEPQMPENYMVSDEVKSFEESTMLNVIEKNRVESKIMALNCDRPGEKPVITVQETLEQLYADKAIWTGLINEAAGYETQIDALKKQAVAPEGIDAPALQEYLDLMGPEDWAKRQEYMVKGNELERRLVPYDIVDLREFVEYLQALPTYNKIKDLEANMVKCPECEHEFPLMQSAIDDLKKQIPEGFDMERGKQKWEETLFFKHNAGLKDLHEAIKDREAFIEHIARPVEAPVIGFYGTRSDIQMLLNSAEKATKAQASLAEIQQKYDEVMMKLTAIGQVEYEKKISTRKLEEEALRAYDTNEANYKKFQDYIEETKDWLKNLEGCEEELKKFKQQYTESLTFENAVEEWKKRLQANELLGVQLTAAKDRLTELTRVRKSLQDLKPRVKLYLVPSLNRVASNLLSQMTNGQRNVIDVNEDFEITVDNQSIDELSGSGKAVTNLAIRIGLGTVLTNRVFSVLLADEVDASMDDTRAAFTAETLKNLTKTFSQIILVSHQKPEADHQIEV